MGEPEFTNRKWENWSLQKESGRTEVYRKKVGELEFTDTKVGELEFTDRK